MPRTASTNAVCDPQRRGGRVAEGGGLLNRYRGSTSIVSSNLIPSAKWLFYVSGFIDILPETPALAHTWAYTSAFSSIQPTVPSVARPTRRSTPSSVVRQRVGQLAIRCWTRERTVIQSRSAWQTGQSWIGSLTKTMHIREHQ